MDRSARSFPGIAGLLAIMFAAPAAAAPVIPNKQAKAVVQVLPPIALRKIEDLNFATLGVYGAGTAVIDPNTDAMATTGGVTHLSGLPYAALFEAISPRKGVVIIRIPNKPTVVTRSGGTETMTVSNWTLDGNSNRTVVAQEPLEFKVGGTLTVNNNQAEGLYIGTFDVSIQYP
jgi:hypothetical protein